MSSTLSLPRTIWLLASLRLRAQVNQISVRALHRGANARARKATAGKRRASWPVVIFIAMVMLFNSFNVSYQAVARFHHAFNAPGSTVASAAMQAGAGLIACLLAVVMLSLPLAAQRQLGQPDWELEWLSHLPVARGRLLWCRLAERGLLSVLAMLLLWPFYFMFALKMQWGWASPLVALAVTVPVALVVAALGMLAESGLKLILPMHMLRNLHALMSLVAAVCVYAAMSFGMPKNADFVWAWAANWPHWAAWLPTGLALQVLADAHIAPGLRAMALLLAECTLLTGGVMLLLQALVREGLVRGGQMESGRRTRKAVGSHTGRGLRWALPFTALQRRELRLLARDRNFMVQCLVMPVLVIGGQLLFNGGTAHVKALLVEPALLASAAFGLGAYALAYSALRTLNHEGEAMWMMYTFPVPLERLLREKVTLWMGLGLLYPLVVLGLGYYAIPSIDLSLIASSLMALAGIPIYTMIAVGLGIFAYDPGSPNAHGKPTYALLYLMLASLYTSAVYQADPVMKLVMLVLSMGLAYALWQKARDALPYLLDPVASPPTQVSAADGLMATMLFLVLQRALSGFLHEVVMLSTDVSVVVGFAVAGLITVGLARYSYWRAKVTGIPRVLGAPVMQSLRVGVAGAVVTIVVGLAWLALVQHFQLWAKATEKPGATLSAWAWLPLGVIAAPMCEEFIFRGLIFGGLRRSLSLPRAMLLSAGLFAMLHPAPAVVPVFLVGLCTAYAYERTKTLAAPMLVHALYNFVVLGWQIWHWG